MPDHPEHETEWRRLDRASYEALPGILLVVAALVALLGVVLLLAGETQGVTALSGPLLFSALAVQLRSKQGGWWRA
ncbi:MAG: hypothetical protein LC808_01550 [Actinobacteria bacterium]|nr:hypothetical protein [Actinomycetota bacterium]